MATILKNLGDIHDYLVGAGEDFVFDVNSIAFEDELGSIKIHIAGDNYHGSFPASFATGLAELQSNIYKSVAYALYGTTNSIKLKNEDKEAFQLVFEVSEGTTGITASVVEIIKNLSNRLVDGMSEEMRARVILGIVAGLVVGWGVTTVTGQYFDSQTQATDAATQIAMEKEKTRQFEIISRIASDGDEKNIVKTFQHYNEESTRALIKGASDADYIQVGAKEFNKEDIAAVNKRSSKAELSAEIVTGAFRVSNIEYKDNSITKITAVDVATGEMYGAMFEDELFNETERKLISDTARLRRSVNLSLNVSRRGEEIKSVRLESID